MTCDSCAAIAHIIVRGRCLVGQYHCVHSLLSIDGTPLNDEYREATSEATDTSDTKGKLQAASDSATSNEQRATRNQRNVAD